MKSFFYVIILFIMSCSSFVPKKYNLEKVKINDHGFIVFEFPQIPVEYRKLYEIDKQDCDNLVYRIDLLFKNNESFRFYARTGDKVEIPVLTTEKI